MNKDLISEIKKMSNLMGLSNSQNYILEQELGLERYYERNDKPSSSTTQKRMGFDQDYKLVKMGPNTEYPLMLPSPISVVTDPTKQPSIKKFTTTTSLKEFFPKDTVIKTFVKGDKLTNGNPAPVGQDYIVKNNVKYCLPDKNWTELHTKGGYVYQFTNQKTNETFGLKFRIVKTGVRNGTTLKGLEISTLCLGGDNGWTFELDPNTKPVTMFYSKKDNKPFNPEIDQNNQSDFDDWWNEWKIWVEIAVGVAASFVSGGLAGILLNAGRVLATLESAGPAISALGRLIVFLGESSYAGGSSSWLKVLLGTFIEAGAMTPVALQYLEEGDDTSAYLAWIFSFLPFLLEVNGIQRFIKTGRLTKQESEVLGNEILSKMKKSGGYDAVTSSINSEWTFVSSLSDKAKELYMGVKKLAVKEPKLLTEGFELSLKENSQKIIDTVSSSTNELLSTAKTTLEKTNRWLNPITGKGLLPQFVRSTFVIGPVTIGSMGIYTYLKSLNLSDQVAGELTNQYSKKVEFSEYWKKLAELNQKLGINELTEKQTIESLKEQIVSNPNAIQQMLDSNVAQKEFFNQEEVDKQAQIQAQKEITKYQEVFREKKESLGKDTELLNALEKLNIYKKTESLSIDIQLYGYNVSEWTDTKDPNKWTFTTDDNLMGEIIFNPNNTYDIFIDGKKMV